jgi:hypothetical protein
MFQGPFFLGHELYNADITIAPFFSMMFLLEEFRDFVVPSTEEFRNWHSWSENLLKHPAVTPTLIPKEELRAFYSQYANRTIFNFHTEIFGHHKGKMELINYGPNDMLEHAFTHEKFPRKPRRKDHVDD